MQQKTAELQEELEAPIAKIYQFMQLKSHKKKQRKQGAP